MQMIDRGNTESAAVINCPRWLIRIHDFIRLANQVFYVWMLVLKYIFFFYFRFEQLINGSTNLHLRTKLHHL